MKEYRIKNKLLFESLNKEKIKVIDKDNHITYLTDIYLLNLIKQTMIEALKDFEDKKKVKCSLQDIVKANLYYASSTKGKLPEAN